MRLLELGGNDIVSLTKDLTHDIPQYAILSHTWGDEDHELTMRDIMDGSGKAKAGYRKIQFCADRALGDGLKFIWVDTCCIDKSNSVELSEAIISMFRWYQNSTKCYSWQHDFRKSRWFTRGWTLQELLAPQSVEFFSLEGNLLGDKNILKQTIFEITGIALRALEGDAICDFSVSERLSWAEFRETKRKEDKAYSLLGMFNAYMPQLYGEGIENAFRRLREEIDKDSNSTQTAKYTECDRMDKYSGLLQSLMFNNMLAREAQLDKANTATFEWIWEMPEGSSNLTQWLSTGTGVFWIQGKPGSGKSTLMNYLKEDIERKQWLEQISKLYSKIWEFGRESIPLPGIEEELVWTISKLREGLISTLKACTANVIMLIDGVDELEGGARSMLNTIEFFQELAGLDNTTRRLKICLASRPDPLISTGFSGSFGFKLQDCNNNGIERYVNSRFKIRAQHSSVTMYQDNLVRFTESIVQRSRGVFLWARFATDEILLGVAEGDELHELWARLEALPDELLEIYARITKRCYRIHETSIMLQIAYFTLRPLSLQQFFVVFQLSMKQPATATLYSPETFEKKLQARTGGLVEVVGGDNGVVKLIHETVRTYLDKVSGGSGDVLIITNTFQLVDLDDVLLDKPVFQRNQEEDALTGDTLLQTRMHRDAVSVDNTSTKSSNFQAYQEDDNAMPNFSSKRKRGSLSRDAAKMARQMRGIPACFICWMKMERCGREDPCGPCSRLSKFCFRGNPGRLWNRNTFTMLDWPSPVKVISPDAKLKKTRAVTGSWKLSVRKFYLDEKLYDSTFGFRTVGIDNIDQVISDAKLCIEENLVYWVNYEIQRENPLATVCFKIILNTINCTTSIPSPSIKDALILWAIIRALGDNWLLSGAEIASERTESNQEGPLPPILRYQLEAILQSEFIEPLSENVFSDLRQSVKTRQNDWLAQLLVIFLLLHNCDTLFSSQRRTLLSRHQQDFPISRQEYSSKVEAAGKALLSIFDIISTGKRFSRQPLKEILRSETILRTNLVELNYLDETTINLISSIPNLILEQGMP